MIRKIKSIYKNINRNNVPIDYNINPIEKNMDNLQYCNREKNIGDLLSKIVVDYMLKGNK